MSSHATDLSVYAKSSSSSSRRYRHVYLIRASVQLHYMSMSVIVDTVISYLSSNENVILQRRTLYVISK